MIGNGFDTATDAFSPENVYEQAVLTGLYRLAPTGNFIDNDYQYIEVGFRGITIPASPCYGFGARAYVPSAEWLEQYKDQVFFWCMFDRGLINRCVFIGWGFISGKEQDVEDFPNSTMFRTEKFLEAYNDKKETFTITHRESKDKFEFGKQGTYVNTQEAVVTVQNKVVVDSPVIKLGSEEAFESAVLGTTLNATLTELLNVLINLNTVLVQGVSTVGATAAATPATIALSAPLTAFATQLSQITPNITTIIGKLADHLSIKNTLE